MDEATSNSDDDATSVNTQKSVEMEDQHQPPQSQTNHPLTFTDNVNDQDRLTYTEAYFYVEASCPGQISYFRTLFETHMSSQSNPAELLIHVQGWPRE